MKKQADSAAYIEIQNKLAEAGVCADFMNGAEMFDGAGYRVYSAPDRCCLETAETVFRGKEIRTLDELREIPYTAAFETLQPLPVRVWDVLAGYQCKKGLSPQEESEKESLRRAGLLLERLEKENRDCILVSHSRFIRILMKALRKRGYIVTRGGYGEIGYLERIRAAGKDLHCGACKRNCLLSNPGCAVGKDKAARRK